MKRQALCFGALVLALLVLVQPSSAALQQGTDELMKVRPEQTKVRGSGDSSPGDVFSTDGDPDDLLGGNNIKPQPVMDAKPSPSVRDAIEALLRILTRAISPLL
jgi:hypothetical protein